MHCERCGSAVEFKNMAEALIDRTVDALESYGLQKEWAGFDEYAEEIKMEFAHPSKPFGMEVHCFMLTTASRDPDLEEGELMFDWEIELTGQYIGTETHFEGWSVYEYNRGKIRRGQNDYMKVLRKGAKRTMGSDFRG